MRHLIITYLPSNEVSLEVLSILLTSYSQCQAQFLTHNRLLQSHLSSGENRHWFHHTDAFGYSIHQVNGYLVPTQNMPRTIASTKETAANPAKGPPSKQGIVRDHGLAPRTAPFVSRRSVRAVSSVAFSRWLGPSKLTPPFWTRRQTFAPSGCCDD